MSKQSTMPQEENKMGVMPVNRLIVNMSLPMSISGFSDPESDDRRRGRDRRGHQRLPVQITGRAEI